MSMLLRCLLAGLAILCAAPSGPARAAMVTYTFTGTISTLADPSGILGGQVHLGDTYTGTLVYDTSTATGVSTSATRASYAYNTAGTNRNFVAPIGITAQIGSFSLQPDRLTGDMSLAVYNNAPSNLGGVADGLIAQQDSYLNNSLVSSTVSLGDRTASVFSSTALPSTLNTSTFTDGTFSFYNYTNSTANVLFSGTINGLATVPEPASLVLLGGGLLVIGLAKCRASRRPA